MFARLSVDTELVHDYGGACAAHAADLETTAVRLGAVGTGCAAVFGPVGASFLAALARAAAAEASTLGTLRGSVGSGTAAARESATAYRMTDADAGARIAGTC